MSTSGDTKVHASNVDDVANAYESIPNDDRDIFPVVPENGSRPKRIPILTEKGREYQSNNLRSYMKTMYKRIQKNIDLIHVLLDGDNEELVNNECANLEKTFAELSDAYSRIGILFEGDDSSEAYTTVTIQMDEADSEYFACKQFICKWLLDREMSQKGTSEGFSKLGQKRCLVQPYVTAKLLEY